MLRQCSAYTWHLNGCTLQRLHLGTNPGHQPLLVQVRAATQRCAAAPSLRPWAPATALPPGVRSSPVMLPRERRCAVAGQSGARELWPLLQAAAPAQLHLPVSNCWSRPSF